MLSRSPNSGIAYDQLIAEYWREGGGDSRLARTAGKIPGRQALRIGDYTGKLYALYDANVAPNV